MRTRRSTQQSPPYAVAVIGRRREGAEREPADEPGRDRAAAVIRPIAIAAPIGRTVAPAAAPNRRAMAAPAAAPMAAPLRFRRSGRADHRGAERQRRDGAENRPLRFREGKSHGECPCSCLPMRQEPMLPSTVPILTEI